jgi:hypothetical protein
MGTSQLLEQRLNSSLNVRPLNKTQESRRERERTTTTTTTITKKTSLEIPRQELKKINAGVTASSIARTVALTAHMLLLSVFFLNNKTWQTQRTEKKFFTTDKEGSKKNRPFSRRTFRKEVNTLARKAGKKRVLGLYAAALKREQDKESKAKVVKRRAIKAEDSSSSEDSISVNNLEKPIPCKNAHKFRVAKVDSKVKSTKKADKKNDNKEMDIGLLSAVKKMQIEDDYDMLDSDDDVLSLDDDEISITSADV